jgi:hypothetical protein
MQIDLIDTFHLSNEGGNYYETAKENCFKYFSHICY